MQYLTVSWPEGGGGGSGWSTADENRGEERGPMKPVEGEDNVGLGCCCILTCNFAPSSTKPCPKLQDSPPILILGHLTPTLLNKFIYRTGRWRNSRSSKRHKLRQSTDSNAGIAGVSSVCVPVPSLTTRAQLARRLNEWWNPNPPWLESLRGFCKNARTSHHGNLTEMRFLNPDSRALHTMAEDREAVERNQLQARNQGIGLSTLHTTGHFTHETESPWPLHFKHSHWWERRSRSKFTSHYAWGTVGVMWMQDGCKVSMDSYMASSGSCFMVTWTIFKDHLLEVGLTQIRRPWHSKRSQLLIYSNLSCVRTCMNRCSLK